MPKRQLSINSFDIKLLVLLFIPLPMKSDKAPQFA